MIAQLPNLSFDPYKPPMRRPRCPLCGSAEGGKLICSPLGDRVEVSCDTCDFAGLYERSDDGLVRPARLQIDAEPGCRRPHKTTTHPPPATNKEPEMSKPSEQCAVLGCVRDLKNKKRMLCAPCYTRWHKEGKPDLGQFQSAGLTTGKRSTNRSGNQPAKPISAPPKPPTPNPKAPAPNPPPKAESIASPVDAPRDPDQADANLAALISHLADYGEGYMQVQFNADRIELRIINYVGTIKR